MITIPFPRWLRITAFAGFAVLLFVGTHWPKLRIDGPFERPDLAIHLVVFGMWAFLLCVSGIFGEPGRLATSAKCFGVGLVYAAFDESTQMIPALGRFAAMDDYLFNVIGLMLGTGLSQLVLTKPQPKPLR